jgi:hypothetical protein
MHTYSYIEYVCILLPEVTPMINLPFAKCG